MKLIKYCTVAASVLFFSTLHAGGQWELVLDKGDVKGYSRAVEGSDILEFRSTMVVDAKIEIVGAVLRNVEGLKESSKYCTEARIIEKKDKNNYIFYARYSYSPPISDRDIVIRVTTRYDYSRGRAVSDLVALRDPLVPEKPDCIRIYDYRAQFVIEYINRERTGLVFTSRMDPRGHIPIFLVNYMSKRALYSSALDLREAVKKKKYIEAARQSGDLEIVQRLAGNSALMRGIISNRLGDFIRDADFVTLIVRDDRMVRLLQSGEGEISSVMLHGWGSHRSKMTAVKSLLKMYMGLFCEDAKKVERAIDNDLIGRVLSGSGGAQSVQKIIDRLMLR